MFTQNNYSYTPVNIRNYSLVSVNNQLNFKELTILEYFNLIYIDGYFLEAIYELLQNYHGFSYEGCYGYYPNWNSPYSEDHFEEGLVCFAICFDDEDNRIYISERQFFRYAKSACQRFLEIHTEYNDFIMNILNNWKPKYPDKFPDTIDGNTV